MKGLFVTATDTGVGKTFVSAAICLALRSRGLSVNAAKPIVTGLAEPTTELGHDHEILAKATGQTAEQVTNWCFDDPVSPHLAVQTLSTCGDKPVPNDPQELINAVHSSLGQADAGVVEGVGGIMVPLLNGRPQASNPYFVLDLIKELNLGVVLVARPGLGTINHTLMSANLIVQSGLQLKAIVLNQWQQQPTKIEAENLRFISSQFPDVSVTTFPQIDQNFSALADAAAHMADAIRWI